MMMLIIRKENQTHQTLTRLQKLAKKTKTTKMRAFKITIRKSKKVPSQKKVNSSKKKSH